MSSCPNCARQGRLRHKRGTTAQYYCARCDIVFVGPAIPRERGIQTKPKPSADAVDAANAGRKIMARPKVELFCQYCLTEANPTEAAVKAGYGKPKTGPGGQILDDGIIKGRHCATVIAAKLLRRKDVADRIQYLTAQQTASAFALRDRIVGKLANIALGKLTDVLTKSPDGGEMHITADGGTPNPDAIKKIKTRTFMDENGKTEGFVEEIEMHDPIRAAAVLADYQGWKSAEDINLRVGAAVFHGNIPEPDPVPDGLK